MRVIAGSLKGRSFESVPGNRTHPMSEKIRGALFNALGDIQDLTLLDAYAGTGALSIEAISRGAREAIAIDADIKATKTMLKNIEELGIEDKIQVTRAFIKAWSRRHPNNQFDIVILDPPYNNIEPKQLLSLTKHVRKGGVLIISLPPESGFRLAPSRQTLLLEKNYGDAELLFYRQL